MLGGADNPNGELLSYIIGADNTGSIDGNDLTSTIPLQSIYSMSHCTC